VKRRIAWLLATWFGCGYVPYAPGTAGTLGAVPLYLALRPFGWVAVVAAAAVATFVGVWAANVVVDETHKKDPQIVVIDEVAGVLIVLAAARPSHGWVIAGVTLFRALDQLKPWPARWAERTLPRGWGVVFDDVFAGLWGAAILLAIRAVH
jgi:phosphatidylglycerophosphatase A